MKNLILAIPFFLAIYSSAQTASFKEIKLKPDAKYYNTTGSTIAYPIIATKNPQIDALINAQVKNDMFSPEDEKQDIKTVLDEHIHDYGLTDLSYRVTYNKNGLLSFCMEGQSCGAYCSLWETYFNFDLKTGKKISVYDLFASDKIERFKNTVSTDKVTALNKYKQEEKSSFINGGIDSVTYNWAIEQVDDECINKVSIENFSLAEDTIEIIDDCEFPHAIRSQQPTIELKYQYKNVSGFLNPQFRWLLK